MTRTILLLALVILATAATATGSTPRVHHIGTALFCVKHDGTISCQNR